MAHLFFQPLLRFRVQLQMAGLERSSVKHGPSNTLPLGCSEGIPTVIIITGLGRTDGARHGTAQQEHWGAQVLPERRITN